MLEHVKKVPTLLKLAKFPILIILVSKQEQPRLFFPYIRNRPNSKLSKAKILAVSDNFVCVHPQRQLMLEFRLLSERLLRGVVWNELSLRCYLETLNSSCKV